MKKSFNPGNFVLPIRQDNRGLSIGDMYRKTYTPTPMAVLLEGDRKSNFSLMNCFGILTGIAFAMITAAPHFAGTSWGNFFAEFFRAL